MRGPPRQIKGVLRLDERHGAREDPQASQGRCQRRCSDSKTRLSDLAALVLAMRMLNSDCVHVTGETGPSAVVRMPDRVLLTLAEIGRCQSHRLSNRLNDAMVGTSVVTAVHAQQMHCKHHGRHQGHHDTGLTCREREATKTGRDGRVGTRVHTPPCVVILNSPARPKLAADPEETLTPRRDLGHNPSPLFEPASGVAVHTPTTGAVLSVYRPRGCTRIHRGRARSVRRRNLPLGVGR